MGTNLYVGNVAFSTTEDQVKDLFAEMGNVTRCQLILDRYTNKSRGFAFVEMGTQEEADKAVAELNGKELDGRRLVVNEARPREERPPRRNDDFGGERQRGFYDRY